MTEKTLEQLQETHSEMLATAHDLGLELPTELTLDFTDAGAGAAICSNIDALIRAHREGREVLAGDDDKGHNATSAPQPKRTKKSSSGEASASPPKAKKASAKKPADKKSAGTNTEEKTDVAKSPAKKSAAKKAAKKKSTANARTKAGGGKQRATFAEDAKITATGKENPSSLDSGKGQRIANVLKHNGKTVKTYLSTGKGKRGTLGWCVANGLVKVA